MSTLPPSKCRLLWPCATSTSRALSIETSNQTMFSSGLWTLTPPSTPSWLTTASHGLPILVGSKGRRVPRDTWHLRPSGGGERTRHLMRRSSVCVCVCVCTVLHVYAILSPHRSISSPMGCCCLNSSQASVHSNLSPVVKRSTVQYCSETVRRYTRGTLSLPSLPW